MAGPRTLLRGGARVHPSWAPLHAAAISQRCPHDTGLTGSDTAVLLVRQYRKVEFIKIGHFSLFPFSLKLA